MMLLEITRCRSYAVVKMDSFIWREDNSKQLLVKVRFTVPPPWSGQFNRTLFF